MGNPRASLRPLGAVLALVSPALSSCGGAGVVGNPPPVVSNVRSVDEGVESVRRALALGAWDEAAALAARLDREGAEEGVRRWARYHIARLALRQGQAGPARTWVRRAEPQDPVERAQWRLLLGLLALHDGSQESALERLAPLARALPDRAQSAEVACATAWSTAGLRSASALQGLLALAQVEAALAQGVRFVPLEQGCGAAEERRALLEQLLQRQPGTVALAQTLDALPAGSPSRQSVALALRQAAREAGELERWRSRFADLPDDGTASERVVERPAVRVPIGLLAPVSGGLAPVGAEMVRAAQLAVEREVGARVLVADEGRDAGQVCAALAELVSQGVHHVVGPSNPRLADALRECTGEGLTLWLVSPGASVPASARSAVAAGPDLAARVLALVDQLGPPPLRVGLSIGDGQAGLEAELRARLGGAGYELVSSAAEVQVVAGLWPREQRLELERRSAQAGSRVRWVVESRAGLSGANVTRVGLPEGPGAAAAREAFCASAGASITELGLLVWSAVRGAWRASTAAPAEPPLLRLGAEAEGRTGPDARCEP